MDKKIQITNLYKSFNNQRVLTGINLSVDSCSSLVILGQSGSGKSVLLKTIVGLLSPDQGSILIDSQAVRSVTSKDQQAILQRCGYLFQGGALFDFLTVLENVIFPLDHLQNLDKKTKIDIAVSKLEEVGLSTQTLNLYPRDLSGGMQKRVALARAIVNSPTIILLDEPTSGLDPIMSNVINETITKIRHKLKATTITITHDITSANHIATDIAFLMNGKIQWHGTKQEMANNNDIYFQQFLEGRTSGPIPI